MAESTADRKTRLAKDIPKARAAYEAERATIDARTIKLRELRLARDAAAAAAEEVAPPKREKNRRTRSP